jgi:hypothetical protein
VHKMAVEARVQWSGERTRLFIRNRLVLARKWNLSWAKLSPRIVVYLIKAALGRRLMPALAGLSAALDQDSSLLKRSMNPKMILYLKQNETRFHDSPFEYSYRQILKIRRRLLNQFKPVR